MCLTRRIVGKPPDFLSMESRKRTKEELQHNKQVIQLIRELVTERKAKLSGETMVGGDGECSSG